MWQAQLKVIHTHLICAQHTCELRTIIIKDEKNEAQRLGTVVYKY